MSADTGVWVVFYIAVDLLDIPNECLTRTRSINNPTFHSNILNKNFLAKKRNNKGWEVVETIFILWSQKSKVNATADVVDIALAQWTFNELSLVWLLSKSICL